MEQDAKQGRLLRYLLAQRDPARSRWLRRLLRASGALTLLLLASLLVTAGWLLGNRFGDDAPIVVDRPVENIIESSVANGRMPNVLGLDRDDAVQAIAGSGVDPARITVERRPYVGSEDLAVDQRPGPAEKIDDKTAVTLVLAQAAQMPDLEGKPVDDATDTLSEMGATVSTEHRYGGADTEGAVLSSAPQPGGSLASGNVKLVVGDAPSSVFLGSVEALESGCDTSSEDISVGGRDLPNSLTCSASRGYSAISQYVLKGRAEILQARVGVSDENESTRASATFRVSADGRTLATRTVPFGSSAAIRVSIADALRLRISVHASGDSDSTTAVWGSAKLIGGREAIDSLSSNDEG